MRIVKNRFLQPLGTLCYSNFNKSYLSDRFYVSYVSLTGMKIKLRKCKAPYYPPIDVDLKMKKTLKGDMTYKIIRKNSKHNRVREEECVCVCVCEHVCVCAWKMR